MRGKSINLFLMDGRASGRIKCTLANWTGVVYKIPRTELEKSRNREDLKQSGVYFLFGVSDETGDSIVYVGQAGSRKNGEGILYRLQEHKRSLEKDYWTEAVVFTTSNNSFGPTEISYLENRFFNKAKEANRYKLINSVDPNPGHVTEEKESELEEFIDYAEITMGVLGHKIFEPIDEIKDIKEAEVVEVVQSEPILFIESSTVMAKGRRTSEGFIVYKGAVLSTSQVPSTPTSAISLREKHSTKIIDGVLQEDILFNSPSAASSFVKFYSTNGWTEWKTAEGKTLRDVENEGK